MPACPQCGTDVQPHWDWCEGCGYDPDHLRPAAARPTPPPPPIAPGLRPPPFAEPAPPPLYAPGPPMELPYAPTAGSGHRRGRRIALIVGAVAVGLVVVAIAAVALLGRAVEDPSAQAWSTPDGAVTVAMRGTPHQQSTPAAAGLSSTSLWESKNHFSSFSVEDDVITPGAQVNAAQVLAAVPAAVTSTVPSATITSSEATTFQGYPAERFSYKAPSQNAVARGIAVITPTHLFVVVGGTTPSDTDKIDPYLASFKINP